jgi:hypothetical protein
VQLERVVSRCAAHAALASDATVYNVVYTLAASEQRRKNRVHQLLIEDTTLGLSDFNAETGTYTWKNGKGFAWNWTGTGADRVLQVQPYGVDISNPKRNAIQNWLDTNFGAGKVVLI